MDKPQVVPDRAAIAISDMLEHCARIQPGQEVSILAHLDGLRGGDNPVDRVEDVLLHDRGYLTILNYQSVIALAAKYPGRPGLPKC